MFLLSLFQMMIVFVLLALLLQADAQCATPIYGDTAAGTLTTDATPPRLGLRFTSSVAGCLQGVRFNLVGVNATNSSNVTVEASFVCAVLCSLTSWTRRPSTARVLGRALPKALGSPRPDFRRCLSPPAFPLQQTRSCLSHSTRVCANGALPVLHTTPLWPMVFSPTSIRGISINPTPTLCRWYGVCCARCRGHYANAASAPRIFWQYHLLCGARFLPRRMRSARPVTMHVWYPNRDEHLGHWFVFFLF
jgi:hypothetical protein